MASIGASAMLVAAITLSLLSASALFALGGLEGSGEAGSGESVVLDPDQQSGAHAARTSVVAVLDRRAAPPSSSASAVQRAARPNETVRAAGASVHIARPSNMRVASLGSGATGEPPVRPPVPPVATKRPGQTLGDGVKHLGDGLSSVVTQTATNFAAATAPLLGPSVAATAEQILDFLALLLKGTTDGLGGLLGASP